MEHEALKYIHPITKEIIAGKPNIRPTIMYKDLNRDKQPLKQVPKKLFFEEDFDDFECLILLFFVKSFFLLDLLDLLNLLDFCIGGVESTISFLSLFILLKFIH